MSKSKQGKRRTEGNRIGKLIRKHSEAALELGRAKAELRKLKRLAVEDGDARPYQSRIDELKERTQALEKLVSDLYDEIYTGIGAK